MATGIESVLRMREDPRFKMSTSFPFEIALLPHGEMFAKITPPSEIGVKPNGPLFLTLVSDKKGSSIIPFQSPTNLEDVKTSHSVGGVVIGIGGEEKLIIYFEKYPRSYIPNQSQADFWGLRFRLMNANNKDQSILVKPEDGEEPYVLQNNLQNLDSNKQSLIFYDNGSIRTNNGLEITHADGVTLVEPHSL